MTGGFFRDIVRSLRSWRRTPGSALLVIFALGLSSGALISLISLFNALFWRELPVTHPEELVRVSGTDPREPAWASGAIPESLFASLEQTESVFQGFGGSAGFESAALIRDSNQRLAIEGVSSRYFETLGVPPALGLFVGNREVDSALPVATISFRCWQMRFGADRTVIGQTFRVNGELLTVIGVTPRAFTGLQVGVPTDAWVPASLVPRLLNLPGNPMFFDAVVGRLRRSVTLQHAKAQIETLWPSARQAAAETVATSPRGRDDILVLQPRIESAARGLSRAGYRVFYRRPLVLLVLCSVITVVLACANLSGLLLARWSTREVDLAVQTALGASNSRLVAQVVGESLALSTVAVMLSVPLALWSAKGLTLLVWNQPDLSSSPLDLTPDSRVLGVMILLTALVALCVSLLPAARIWSAKVRLIDMTRGLPGRSVTGWGRRLAAAQVALSVPLLVTAWIVAANLQRLESVSTGFRADGVVVATVIKESGNAAAADPVAYLTRLNSTLRAVPGIAAAALTWNEPLSFGSDARRRPVSGGDGLRDVRSFVLQVSPGYFDTLSVPLVAGRDFTWTDDGRQRNVAIVSEGLARALFPGADPLGQRVRLAGPPDRFLEVVGVAADARIAEPHAMNQLFLFTALLQEPLRLLELRSPLLLLKSPLAPNMLEAQARSAIVALGRDDFIDVHALQRTLGAALLRERVMRLGGFYFAGLTTLLVFVGLNAVLNLGIVRRIPEIGLRIALGASTLNIQSMVIREALVTAAVGLAVGLPCALVSGRVVATSLTLIGPHDVLAFVGAIALILIVTALSVLIPLRRAARITPVDALSSR